MNKNYNMKNKFLKNIALSGFLFGSFAGTFPQLWAGPLHKAAADGNEIAVARLLREGFALDEKDEFGYVPLHYASDPDMIDVLLNTYNNARGDVTINETNPSNGDTPLHCAVRAPDPDLIRIGHLLSLGADKDKKNHEGHSPASIITKIVQTNAPRKRKVYTEIQRLFSQIAPRSLHDAVADDDIAGVQRLLAAGADPNGKDEHGTKPLHHAGNLQMIDLLCGKGANINGIDQFGDTLLHWAVSEDNPNLEYIKRLLQKGASVDVANRNNDTPLLMVERTIRHGVIANGSQIVSESVTNSTRLAYFEVLRLFLLPQRLW
jgi:ankyrin repeat protein